MDELSAALRIHGFRTEDNSNNSESDSGASDFDSRYYATKPPSVPISLSRKVVVIKASEISSNANDQSNDKVDKIHENDNNQIQTSQEIKSNTKYPSRVIHSRTLVKNTNKPLGIRDDNNYWNQRKTITTPPAIVLNKLDYENLFKNYTASENAASSTSQPLDESISFVDQKISEILGRKNREEVVKDDIATGRSIDFAGQKKSVAKKRNEKPIKNLADTHGTTLTTRTKPLQERPNNYNGNNSQIIKEKSERRQVLIKDETTAHRNYTQGTSETVSSRRRIDHTDNRQNIGKSGEFMRKEKVINRRLAADRNNLIPSVQPENRSNRSLITSENENATSHYLPYTISSPAYESEIAPPAVPALGTPFENHQRKKPWWRYLLCLFPH